MPKFRQMLQDLVIKPTPQQQPTTLGAYLKDCLICIECDYIFVGASQCPKCGSSFMPLARWFKCKDAAINS